MNAQELFALYQNADAEAKSAAIKILKGERRTRQQQQVFNGNVGQVISTGMPMRQHFSTSKNGGTTIVTTFGKKS